MADLDAATADTLAALAVWLVADPSEVLAEAVQLHAARCARVGSPLALAVRRRGLSQGKLARRCNVTPAAITNFVRGRSRPSAELARRIARELDATPEEVFAMIEQREKQ